MAAAGWNAFADLHGARLRPTAMDEMQAAYAAFWSDEERRRTNPEGALRSAEKTGGGAALKLARTSLGAALGGACKAGYSGRVPAPEGRIVPDSTAPIFVATGSADDLDLENISRRIEKYDGKRHMFSVRGFPKHGKAASEPGWAVFTGLLADIAGNGA